MLFVSEVFIYGLIAGIVYTAFIIYYQYTYWKYRKMLHIELVPILGNNAPIFFRSTSFAIHSQNLYKRYPDARWYGLFDFNTPTVMLKDPNLIRDICIKNFDTFIDHDSFVTEEMDPIIGSNLFSLRGQRWRDMRIIVTSNFTSVKMRMMFDLILKCSHDFIEYLLNHPEVVYNILYRYCNLIVLQA
jgi:cytochrome P450 family 9